MKLFLYKILKFTSPLIVLTFFIIFFHKSIYKKPYFQKNRSDDLVEILKNNNKKNYNTLILGNSRSQMLKAKNFNNNLKSEETSFHFDNPGGNIYHFYHSLDYFLKNYNAKNIILFLDGQSLKFNDTEFAYHTSLSPKISGNYLKFYFNYFKLFYNYKMIVSIILKESNIDLPDYFKGFILETLDYSQTDFETGDILKGNGEIIGYEDSQPLSSNLNGKNSHSDRLLDHYMAYKSVLDGKCSCTTYEGLLSKERTMGERGEFMSLHRRLLKNL